MGQEDELSIAIKLNEKDGFLELESALVTEKFLLFKKIHTMQH